MGVCRMIVESIKEFIELYSNGYSNEKVLNLDFKSKRLYGELLDYAFSNPNDTNLYNLISDVYKFRFKGMKIDETNAYQYFVMTFNPNQNKCSAKYKTKIGELYLNGDVVPQDYEKALKWFLEDEGRRSPNTLFNLGYMYYYGLGTDFDFEKAQSYFEECVKSQYHQAYYFYACCNYYGFGIESNYDVAFEYFQKTIASHSIYQAESQYYLGLCFLNGYGTEPNYYKAIELFHESASSNYTLAIDKLKELGFGTNVEFDIQKYEKTNL